MKGKVDGSGYKWVACSTRVNFIDYVNESMFKLVDMQTYYLSLKFEGVPQIFQVWPRLDT